MQGNILEYNLQNSTGIISGDDGKRYTFKNTEWKSSDIHPAQGIKVDFSLEGDNATAIYATTTSQNNQTVLKAQQSAGLAVVSLVFGIIGFISSWFLLGIPSLIAVITGHMARSKIARSQGELGGEGLALAGLILGYIVIAMYLLIFMIVGAGVAAALLGDSSTY